MTDDLTSFEAHDLPIRVLIVEDELSDTDRVYEMLRRSDSVRFEIDHSAEVGHALTMLRDGSYDVTLLDLTLPEGDGLDTLARAKVAAASVPIICMASDEAQAVQAVRKGAQDCLIKGRIEGAQLVRTLRHAVERHRLLKELRLAEQRQHHMATHDSLTRLPNRYALEEQLARALALAERSGKNVGLLFIDLDRFKNINDSMGHRIGDKLLRLTADRMSGLIRQSDMLARPGGDEFIFMLQGVDHDYAPAKLAEKILERLAVPYDLRQHGHYRVTCSIGIAVAPRDGHDPATLIRSADTAMYRAKARGGNCYQLYDKSMNEVVTRRFRLECRLRDAFHNGEIQIHYQPKVNFGTGAIVASEALLRWTDWELGTVSPVEFIPLAEESGLITEIGDWTLRKACAQTKAWQELGFPGLGISVNVSAKQLSRAGLRETIVAVLWESGLDPKSLELELTESVLMSEDSEALEVLKTVAQMGIGLALDDFGTGFSSLSYLKAIPIGSVKIDQSFVRHLAIDGDDVAIVAAIISIADKLGLRVVAEGVETEKQHRLLREAGCDECQGFLVSPAVPPEQFLKLLQQQKQASGG